MKSLVAWCIEWGVSVDLVRGFIRGRPDLQSLGTRIGTAKGYSPVEAKKIHAAFLARHEGREAAASA